MSELAEKIEKLYKLGVYPESWVAVDLKTGAITQQEYDEIMGGENVDKN